MSTTSRGRLYKRMTLNPSVQLTPKGLAVARSGTQSLGHAADQPLPMHLPKTPTESQQYGLIKAGSAALAGIAFLVALYLVGSDSCLDSGGKVAKLFYCEMQDKAVVPFPKLIQPGLLLAIILGAVLPSGVVGWSLWRRQLASNALAK